MDQRSKRANSRLPLCAALGVLLATILLAGCDVTVEVDDPAEALQTPEQSPRVYASALEKIRTESDDLSPDELQALRGLMHRPFYTVETREQAFALLEARDPEALKETIAFRLPRIEALQWRRRLCELVAERGWDDLSPALVRGLAYPIPGWVRTLRERPEYLALARLHSEQGAVDAIYEMFLESNTVALQGLRRACWTLLIELGERRRLATLLQSAEVPEDDLMLQDLQAAARELGVIPVNHEEIVWVRTLRQPQWQGFWNEARSVLAGLSPQRRAEFELRDLAILIAASKHEPALLERSKAELYDEVESHWKAAQHHYKGSARRGAIAGRSERLHEYRDQLTWGDLAAMLMAIRAMQAPEVVDHLFDYADRDRLDESTEYGGIIRLDSQNRFEVLEFQPRIRVGDYKFQASQEMFDAGYGAVFHFHFHAQRYNNDTFAGPGAGDDAYADNARANCLVLTFIDEETMNFDFYRHDDVVVDLGEIVRNEDQD